MIITNEETRYRCNSCNEDIEKLHENEFNGLCNKCYREDIIHRETKNKVKNYERGTRVICYWRLDCAGNKYVLTHDLTSETEHGYDGFCHYHNYYFKEYLKDIQEIINKNEHHDWLTWFGYSKYFTIDEWNQIQEILKDCKENFIINNL